MTDVIALEAAASSRIPPIQFPGNTPAEQLTAAFVSARECIFKHVPASYMVDYNDAVLANQSIGAHIEQHGDEIKPYIDQGKDLYEALAFVLPSNELRQFILSQYALACAGMGAYVSGWADQSVKLGALKQTDYDTGIELRMRTFSNIVRLEQEGKLKELLLAENVAAQAAKSTPAAVPVASSGLGSVPAGTTLVIRSGTSVVRVPANGLGEVAILTVIIISVAVVAAISVCALVYMSLRKKEIEASAAIMREICNNAQKAGDKDAIEKCQAYASGLSDKTFLDIIPKAMQSQIVNWLMIGGGIYLALKFGPDIVDAFFATKKRIGERKAEST